jgi:putative oxidoreductase
MGLATTVLRVVTGATMAGHGLQKLTNSLGGHGPDAAGESFESMGFPSGRQFAIATGVAETAGGALMVAGLGTPLACAMVSGVMAGAIAKVHYKNGFWMTDRGFEYNLHILAATFAVAGAGGGALTLDALRGKKHRGFGWALAQLALGAGTAAAALALAERQGGDQWHEGTDGWTAGIDDRKTASDGEAVDLTGTSRRPDQAHGSAHTDAPRDGSSSADADASSHADSPN